MDRGYYDGSDDDDESGMRVLISFHEVIECS